MGPGWKRREGRRREGEPGPQSTLPASAVCASSPALRERGGSSRDPESRARPSTAPQPQAPAQQHRPPERAGRSPLPGTRGAQSRQKGTLLSRDEESSTSCARETQGWAGAALLPHLPGPGFLRAEYELYMYLQKGAVVLRDEAVPTLL